MRTRPQAGPAGTRRDFLKTTGALGGALATTAVAQEQSSMRSSGSSAPRDRGLWITWYDLPENGRDEYLDWLHGTYVPALLTRPGYLWAAHYASQPPASSGASMVKHTDDPSVPGGYRFILLVGGEDSHVFGRPTPSELHAQLPARERQMLALRTGQRMNILAEAGRVEGPAAPTYGDGLTGAPCVQVGSFNCPLDREEEMHGGYVQKRLPAMAAAPTCIRTRKLNSVAGWAKHVIFYEFSSLDGYARDYPPALAASPLGTVLSQLVHAPNGPNSAVRLWPPLRP